jgi:plastocyanin
MAADRTHVVPPRWRVSASVGALVALLVAGCGGHPDDTGDDAEEPRPGSRAPGTPARAVPLAEVTGVMPLEAGAGAVLSGEVRFTGTAPERFVIAGARRPECSHHADVDQRSNAIVVEDGRLAWAFVRVKSGFDRDAIPPVPGEPVILEQKGCMYVPRGVALRTGQTLRVTNADPTVHNVHTRGKRNGMTNRTMGAGQAALEFVFEHAERPVPFQCDLHPWMEAEAWVEEHPWFALTDEHGRFRIEDVPPGELVVEVQHARLGRATARVTVLADQRTDIVLTLD